MPVRPPCCASRSVNHFRLSGASFRLTASLIGTETNRWEGHTPPVPCCDQGAGTLQSGCGNTAVRVGELCIVLSGPSAGWGHSDTADSVLRRVGERELFPAGSWQWKLCSCLGGALTISDIHEALHYPDVKVKTQFPFGHVTLQQEPGVPQLPNAWCDAPHIPTAEVTS